LSLNAAVVRIGHKSRHCRYDARYYHDRDDDDDEENLDRE